MTSTSDSPILETKEMVSMKLASANIQLVLEAPDDLSGHKSVMQFHEKEMLQHPLLSIANFQIFCLSPLHAAFSKDKPSEELVLSVHYLMVMYMIGGYQNAIITLNKKGLSAIKEKSEIRPKIESLFSRDEFSQIEKTLQELLIKFPQQANECYRWIKEDPSQTREQIQSVTQFMKGVRKTQDLPESQMEEILKPLGKKVVDVCMPKGDTSHNLYLNQVRQKYGLLPIQRLLEDIQWILIYLDILHYGGYRNFSLEKEDPKAIHFMRL